MESGRSTSHFARVFFYLGLLCFLNVPLSQSAIQSAYNLHSFLFSNYSSDIRPVNYDTELTYITMGGYLIMIQGLNEVNSQLTTTMSLYMAWSDVQLKWNPADFEGRFKIMVDAEKIWTPRLSLVSPSQKTDPLRKNGAMATIYSSGFVTLSVLDIFYSVCPVDITYYPFDKQVCDLWFANYDYLSAFILMTVNSTLDLSFYYQNGLWTLERTRLFSQTTNNGVTYEIVARLFLKRKASFPILNTLVPIIILMLLNSAVFLLPSESGERLGFAVTILLSIAVYMTIISDELPKTSQPTAILVYVLVAFLAQSALLCIATIYSLRLYFRQSQNISRGWRVFVQVVTYRPCRRRKKSKFVKHHETGVLDNLENSHGNNQIQDHPTPDYPQWNITWKSVSEAFDNLILFINIVVILATVVMYLCLVLPNSE